MRERKKEKKDNENVIGSSEETIGDGDERCE